MVVQYHLYNEFFENKVMMYENTTGLIKLIDPIKDDPYQKMLEDARSGDGLIRYKILNVGNNRFSTQKRIVKILLSNKSGN
jgi:hypothetical protein